MSVAAKEKMSADEFLAWAETQEARWELYDGAPVAMAPERAIHALTKFAAQRALAAAIERGRPPCQMFPDGMTVKADKRNAFEPDALVNCGPSAPANAVAAPNPIVVVEVLSPRTAAHDHGAKLTGYFSIATLADYLILDPERLEAPVADMFAAP